MIVIRTDASIRIGTGHVMRCLALAEQLRADGADVAFLCRLLPGNLVEFICRKGFSVLVLPEPANSSLPDNSSEPVSRRAYEEWLGVPYDIDASETIAALSGDRPEWLIVDHYAIDKAWESLLRPHVQNLMVIDDLADRQHDGDILLDQNFTLDGGSRYHGLVSPACTRLIGPSFALLRSEFSEFRKNMRQRDGEVHRILVFFGGSDPDNLTSMALDALQDTRLNHFVIDVVAGAGNPHLADVRRRVEAMPNAQLHIQVDNMAELMSRSDLAIGAGGTATWERLCLGLPSIVVTIAENQIRFIRDLHAMGLLAWLGRHVSVSVDDMKSAFLKAAEHPDSNRQMSKQGMQLLDGRGAGRVSRILMKGIDAAEWRVRRAVPDDCLLYWHWANDEEVRHNAFNQCLIPWESHELWYRKHVGNPETMMLVVDSAAGPIGQVRFDKFDAGAVISYSLSRQMRRKGLGRKMLSMAIDFMGQQQDADTPHLLIAEVRPENYASSRIFQQLGFDEVSDSQPDRRRFQKMYMNLARGDR
jgi:UDP-2,4-diacetamido-2,4,6-trideoxy-beta-L-altropyranose hydrolase